VHKSDFRDQNFIPIPGEPLSYYRGVHQTPRLLARDTRNLSSRRELGRLSGGDISAKVAPRDKSIMHPSRGNRAEGHEAPFLSLARTELEANVAGRAEALWQA